MRKFLYILILSTTFYSCDESSFSESSDEFYNPSGLKYMTIEDAREGKSITTERPSIQTGGLIPKFEIINIKKSDGSFVDDTFLSFVSIKQAVPKQLNFSGQNVRYDQNGNPITTVNGFDTSQNGVISISEGHPFPIGEYTFIIKVTTEHEGKVYSTVFEDGFKLTILPLLPSILIYSPKNQNLVFGDPTSKTTTPIVPKSNPEVRFELATFSDKLSINENTGVISLASNYTYTKFDTIKPSINVISKITGEVTSFSDVLTAIITDVPVSVPREDLYFFYPTLFTTGSFPSSGDGFNVQVNIAGNGEDIWGVVDNSSGRFLVPPTERPSNNVNQTVLETQTFSSGKTLPTNSWMVTQTQDLTPFQFGYFLSFNYYYQPAYQIYMADGRTPTDLEVYISTDYTGGNIQDADGNWINGTWEKVNEVMKCNRSEGLSGGFSTGAPWGDEFIGTPYPGNQTGPDPDGKKRPGTTFYGRWVKCSYDIPISKISSTFTVAFKVASYFNGELLNNTSAPGRGGSYFLSDFHYKASE